MDGDLIFWVLMVHCGIGLHIRPRGNYAFRRALTTNHRWTINSMGATLGCIIHLPAHWQSTAALVQDMTHNPWVQRWGAPSMGKVVRSRRLRATPTPPLRTRPHLPATYTCTMSSPSTLFSSGTTMGACTQIHLWLGMHQQLYHVPGSHAHGL